MLMIGLYNQAPSNGGRLLLDATPFVTSANFSTDVHGCEALTFDAALALADAFKLYNQTAVVYVGVFDGASLIWEGRLEDPALSTGASGSGFRGQALGYWRALSDVPYTALWSITQMGAFQPILNTDLNTAYPDRYLFDTNNRIYIAAQKNATLGNTAVNKAGYMFYRIPDQSSRDIVGAQFAFTHVAPGASWQAAFQLRNPDFSGISNPWVITSGGAGTTIGAIHVTFTGVELVDFLHWYAAADAVYTGETDASYLRITNLRLVTATTNRVNTTLTVTRTNGAAVTCTVGSTARMYVGMQLVIGSGGANSEMITVLSVPTTTTFTANVVNAGAGYAIGTTVQGFVVYADEIAKDLVSTVAALNSNQISPSTIHIQSPALDLTDEVYQDKTPANILTYLASRGDTQQRAWEVGVGRGQVLYFRPQFSASRAWFVDATDLNLARTLNNLFNSAYALYEDANGRALRTANGSNAASIARYALTRRTAVPASTTSATLAATQRDTFITNNNNPPPRATVRFDAVYDAQGARWTLFLVRSGDTITVRNVPPSISSSYDKVRTFRVTHTTYDLMAGTLHVEPDMAPPTVASMIVKQGQIT